MIETSSPPSNLRAPLVHCAKTGSSPRRLADEIAALLALFGERPVTLGEVMTVLGARAYTLLLLLIALPFCTPIPLPGLSMPFGLIFAWIGFRLALNRAPSLPERLLRTPLPPGFFTRFLGAARGLVRFLETLLRPRWCRLVEARILRHGYGTIIMLCGLFLMLPLPVPFSNGLPALTIVLIAGAMLERDGCCLAAGLAVFTLTLAFYGALAWGGAEGVAALKNWLWEWVGSR